MTRRSFLLSAAAAGTLPAFDRPFGAVPSPRQMAWSKLEYYNFLHFTLNTFTDKEWGYGDEDSRIFNPAQFDADAIVEVLKNAGSKGVILTAKHHDGFCLWPTKTTEHSIRNSPYKKGKGDIVRELSEAASRAGLKFGIYVSPWDRHQASYGTPEYIKIYREQIRELLTGYGPLFEIWHDGANGGDGYYGGAREKRMIDKLHYYDWPNTWALERKLQPGACLFSDVGPDVRWVGNEKGIAGETCWATFTPRSTNGSGPGSPGDIDEKENNTGTRNGKYWMPAECDVSIRPGWFWHASENDKVKSPDELFDLYLKSVGRGASFLLNVPPDRRGLIHENDAASLREFGKRVRQTFGRNVASDVHPIARNRDFVLDLGAARRFLYVRLREGIELGQRVGAFAVDIWKDGGWAEAGKGTSIGMCRILQLAKPATTTRVRLRILRTEAPPRIAEFGLYADAADSPV